MPQSLAWHCLNRDGNLFALLYLHGMSSSSVGKLGEGENDVCAASWRVLGRTCVSVFEGTFFLGEGSKGNQKESHQWITHSHNSMPGPRGETQNMR